MSQREPARVALFITCLTDTFLPRAGEAVVRVLRHFGCRVAFPAAQTCCGQPAINSGFRAEAARAAGAFVSAFAGYEWVVTPSASCAETVRRHLAELIGESDPRHAAAKTLAGRTYEFTHFLKSVLGVDTSSLLRLPCPTTCHYACHSRGVCTPDEFVDSLRRAAGGPLRAPRHVDLCCGFGGLFSLEFPTVSAAMLDQRLSELSESGAELVVCNEAGCTLNLAGAAHRRGLPLRFAHIAELLAESLGLLEPAR